MGMGLTDRNVLESDLPALETVSKSAIKEKQKFERLVLPKEKLLEMFRVGCFFFWGGRGGLLLPF